MARNHVQIDRPVKGRPHEGKVLAVVAPHSDDCPLFCGGTVAKLIDEGYTGYFIMLCNDEQDSSDMSLGQTIAHIEAENLVMAKTLGMNDVFVFNYKNHFLDEISPTEIRSRLVLLLRHLKVDTMFTFDPSDPYEMNPEHTYCAKHAEYCCFLAGGRLDFPEQIAAGIKPHRVKEKYYWARGEQAVNRVVDIAETIERKVDAICACKTEVGNMVRGLRASLARQGRKLPILEADEPAAIRNYVDVCFRAHSKAAGEKHGLAYVEEFRYVSPYYWPKELGEYVEQNAVPTK